MEEQITLCAQYISKLMSESLISARKQGYPYVAFSYDLINKSGMLEPEFSHVFIKDLNDIFRLVKQDMIDLTRVKIFDVTTETEVDKSIMDRKVDTVG